MKSEGEGTNTFKSLYRNLPLRHKMLLVYSSVLVVVLLLAGLFIYSHIRNTIQAHIESELTNSTNTLLNLVETSANTSIRNYLRAVAEKNKNIIQDIYKSQKAGLITEEAAKNQARRILYSQSIGQTGYIYCINSKGDAVAHPNPAVAGQNYLHEEFIIEQINRKDGYLEYEWQGPADAEKRSKALYMAYFEPWDWIISVSSYREEFKKLVNVYDFRESILGLKFGETGYSYVLDSKGNVIIHPKVEGNVYDVTDAKGWTFVRDICARKKGKIIYSWKNPDEEHFREKVVIFNYIKEFDWIVASTSYREEFYAPLVTVGNIILVSVFGVLILGLPFTFWIGDSITHPIQSLIKRFALGSSGDLTVRMPEKYNDEIGQLSMYFNTFMEKLEVSSADLRAEISQRRQTEEDLRESEQKYRNILGSIQEGYFEVDLKGKIIFFNNSMLNILGYSEDELYRLGIRDFSDKQNSEILLKSFSIASSPGHARRSFDCELTKKDGSGCFVEASVSLMNDKEARPIGFRCVLRDVTERKKSDAESRRLEQEILYISEKERQKIGQDLHDDLCPQLIGIEVLIKVLRRKLEGLRIAEADEAAKIETFIQDSINKTRRLSRGLQPVNFAAHGFDSSLAELTLHIKDVFGIACHFHSDISNPFENNVVEATHIYYMVHEAVYNAVKHAKADNIFITLTTNNGRISLNVRDDGKGIPDGAHFDGMGLRIMKYRAEKIGAILSFGKDADRGTLVSIDYVTNKIKYIT
jgi:PAS domain S-box-containing protein